MPATMLKTIHVDQLQPGMFIQRLHGSWIRHPFWRSSFLATAEDVERLRASAVESLEIDVDMGSDLLPEVVDAELPATPAVAHNPMPQEAAAATRMAANEAPALSDLGSELGRARRICQEGRDAVEAMFREVRMGRMVDPAAVMPLADEISASVSRHPGALISIARLKTADDYTYMHSVAVSALMVALARQLGLAEDECREAAMGGLLHDMGKARMPLDILNKPGRLDDAEMEVMRSHAHAGVELLRPADLSPLAVSVVRDHHERIDGSGYPEGLIGVQVQEFPRIAAVADVYDAVTSERIYKPAEAPHVGVRVIREGSGHQFCPTIVRHFRAVVMPYPVGHEVKLPDGRTGVVSAVDIEAPDVPTVRVMGAAGVEEFACDMTAGTEHAIAV